MTLELYYNQSDNRKCGKSLAFMKNVEIIKKHDINSIQCRITVRDSDFDSQCNYVRIVETNKSYFIESPTESIGGVITLNLFEDVLENFAQYIKSMRTYVTRQEFVYNKYFFDDEYPLKVTRTIDCVRGDSIGDPSTNNIILTVCGVD